MTRRPSLVLAVLLALGSLLFPPAVRPLSAQDDDFVYGVIVDTTDARSMRAAAEGGFTHAKMVLHWAAVEPSPGTYQWTRTKENDFDNIMKAARGQDMLLVVRVDGVPGWAGGSPANANLQAVERFYENAARYGADTVVAFEILNEPNLPFEWGGQPDGRAYAAFLKAAYRGVKKGNPDALVIGGGPSPSTGGNGGTVEDLDFLNQMYDAGARGSMDVLGVHNYGGNSEPETDPDDCGGICFRRAELYRDLMVKRGDRKTPIWATEWGYLMDPGRGLGQYDWMKVSESRQADYIVRAHRYAVEHWPWMTGMLLSNLDASTSPYHGGAEDGLPWFAILNSDYSPRAAYRQFQAFRGPYLAIRNAPKPEPTPAEEPPAVAEEPTRSEPDSPTIALTTITPPAAPSGSGTRRLRVVGTDGEGVNLRAAPSLSASRLKTVPEGALLTALGPTQESDGKTWQSVAEPAGTRGWIAAEYLSPVDR